jgi:ribosomal protein S18 acetylase RimI-like enzyme
MASMTDVTDIYNLEKKVWGKTGATKQMIESRLSIFPEGSSVAIEGGKIVGVVFFEIINSKNSFKSWYDYTDNGLIKKSHNPAGDKIFGIDLSVSNDYTGHGLGTDLLLKVADYSIKNGLKGGLLGGRMPYYYKYKDIKPSDYIKLRGDDGRLVDPELRFYTRAGLEIAKVIPNYFEDPESNDYGVLLEWSNPFYNMKSKLGRSIAAFIFRLGFKANMVFSK